MRTAAGYASKELDQEEPKDPKVRPPILKPNAAPKHDPWDWPIDIPGGFVLGVNGQWDGLFLPWSVWDMSFSTNSYELLLSSFNFSSS